MWIKHFFSNLDHLSLISFFIVIMIVHCILFSNLQHNLSHCCCPLVSWFKWSHLVSLKYTYASSYVFVFLITFSAMYFFDSPVVLQSPKNCQRRMGWIWTLDLLSTEKSLILSNNVNNGHFWLAIRVVLHDFISIWHSQKNLIQNYNLNKIIIQINLTFFHILCLFWTKYMMKYLFQFISFYKLNHLIFCNFNMFLETNVHDYIRPKQILKAWFAQAYLQHEFYVF